MTNARHAPVGLDPARFMAEHWQRRPLLLRGAFHFDEPPIDKHELAGLACEEEVTSRIVQEHHPDGPWKLDLGPFDAETFASLPATHWTLLVSDVEKHLPELLTLVEPFRFIPDWRIDDLMISYAVDGGSVGPHWDDYDVFLIQLEGERHWQIATEYDQDAIVDGIDLRILREFKAEADWRLCPGDLLYLPPRVAHYGIARGECLTASVGFRAPSWRELLQDYLNEIVLRLPEDARFGDAGAPPQRHPGFIPETAIDQFRQIIDSHLHLDDASFVRWLGRFLTEPKTDPAPAPAPAMSRVAFGERLAGGSTVTRNPHARFAWTESGDGIELFVDRHHWSLPTSAKAEVVRLSNHFHSNGRDYAPSFHDLLHELYSLDAIWLDDD